MRTARGGAALRRSAGGGAAGRRCFGARGRDRPGLGFWSAVFRRTRRAVVRPVEIDGLSTKSAAPRHSAARVVRESASVNRLTMITAGRGSNFKSASKTSMPLISGHVDVQRQNVGARGPRHFDGLRDRPPLPPRLRRGGPPPTGNKEIVGRPTESSARRTRRFFTPSTNTTRLDPTRRHRHAGDRQGGGGRGGAGRCGPAGFRRGTGRGR
jgi:hypothetical protein